jgi:hypothetical protein
MDQFAVVRDSYLAKEFSAWHRSRLELWNSFCRMYSFPEDSVPLFECDEDNFVQTKEVGKSRPRKVLRRSAANGSAHAQGLVFTPLRRELYREVNKCYRTIFGRPGPKCRSHSPLCS